MLEINHLTKRFGGVTAVDDFSAEVNPGDLVGIIGPNGAGKTTILNLISGVTRPDEGGITMGGKNLLAMGRHEVAHAGVSRTFQNIRLFGSLTVLENIMVILGTRYRLSDRELKAKASQLLQEFGFSGDPSALATSLPYGLQRRVEMVRAMALSPQLLMLDEPAAGLNPTEVDELIEYIARINEQHKVSVILIEHRLEVVMNLCQRMYVLNFGKTIAHGTPAEIQADPAVIAAYLGEGAV